MQLSSIKFIVWCNMIVCISYGKAISVESCIWTDNHQPVIAHTYIVPDLTLLWRFLFDSLWEPLNVKFEINPCVGLQYSSPLLYNHILTLYSVMSQRGRSCSSTPDILATVYPLWHYLWGSKGAKTLLISAHCERAVDGSSWDRVTFKF